MRVGGPEEAAQHSTGAHLLDRRPAVAPTTSTCAPRHRTADALIAAGHSPRPRPLREQLDLLPADAPDADRGQLLAASRAPC